MQYLCIVHVYIYTCTCTCMHYAAIHVTCVLVGMRPTGPVASLKLRLKPSTVHKGLINFPQWLFNNQCSKKKSLEQQMGGKFFKNFWSVFLNPSVTARVKISQNVDILAKVHLPISSALKSQTLSNLTCSKYIYRSKWVDHFWLVI